MEVVLNTEHQGDFTFFLGSDNSVLFPRSALVDMGLVHLPEENSRIIQGQVYVDLKDLAPTLTYTVDTQTVTLKITAAPSLFASQVKRYGHERPPHIVLLHGPSAYVNYSLEYAQGNDYRTFSLPWETAINTGGGVLYSGFDYLRGNGIDRFRRLDSNFTVDDIDHVRRFIFGDYSAASGGLGGGGSFVGISIAKYYSLDPYLIRNEGLNIHGIAMTPSDVSIYLDGQLIRQETVSPGAFELQGISDLGGMHNYQVVIRDAYGRETRLDQSVYLTSSLLSTGVSEYSFNLGLRRQQLSEESDHYSDPTLIWYYRKGLASYYTGGVNLEADSSVLNIGVENHFTLSHAGEMRVSLAASRSGRLAGSAGIASYQYQRRNFNLLLFAENASKDYATVSTPVGTNNIKQVMQFSFGINMPVIGGISITAVHAKHYLTYDSRRNSMSYSRRLLKGVSLAVTGSRTTFNVPTSISSKQYEIFANIVFLLDNTTSGGLNMTRTESDISKGAFLSKSPPLGEGMGYQVNVNNERQTVTGDTDTSGAGILDIHGPYGNYEARYQHNGQSDQFQLRAAGSVGYVDNTLYLSRPIYDGFAVAKVGDIKGVRVMENNQEIGRTNEDGEVMVPQLIPYYENRLSIDDRDIPINYEIDKLEENVSPSYRSGGIVEFPTMKQQGITGHLNVQQGKVTKSAEYWGLALEVRGKTITAVVGQGGEFYFENIPSGAYKAKLFEKDKSCVFDMVIPKSRDMMVDLGRLTCVAPN